MQQNATAAGSPPRTMLAELTALPSLPQTSCWFQGVRGRGEEEWRGGEGKGRTGAGMEGKGRGWETDSDASAVRTGPQIG